MSFDPRPSEASAARTGGLEPAVADELRAGETFGRYRDLRFLGAGGMANVYRAQDPVLGRVVALKLIRGADPGLAERLLAEARAQARVEHEHVCRIYDAGEEGGRPYIAMQYVDGATLQSFASALGLEQKLKIVREVAEAVHAAHRLGLIHRDLKPSNVMLEKTPEGDYVPYVLDFGLAREVAAPGLTMTGMVLGTAWYMSPEQARGDSRALDRRTDVYALGATLYELVCGKPPYDGQSSVDVLVRVLSEDPVPLGVRAPSVPADVRTIVMKCLERDPGRRYDSARALAEDIGRYLDGEPILARPTGMVQRLARRARKNRAAVAAISAAALVVVASGGLAVKARMAARAQAALAAEFAQGVQDVDWFMRAAHLAPAHDVRRERAVVRERLQAIGQRMRAVGALAVGPGEYALGRGQLLLGDAAAARTHLERAWAAGFRSPEAACALGQALGAIYRRELEAADGIGLRPAREARRREIQAAYRDPAVSYLRQGATSGLAPAEYVEGLLAFYEKRYPDALERARASGQRAPWHYEALLLEGDVHAVLSRERHETGDAPGSRAALQQAESSYRAAAEYARSDPAAHSGLCQIGVQRMEWVLYQGADLAPLYEQARGACEAALQVDPDLAEVHAKLANVHRFRANGLIQRGADPLEALDRAAQAADKAIALDPLNRRGHGNRGVVYRMRASWETNHGLDPARSLGAALASLGRAAELAPDAGAFNDLGNAFVTRAEATWGTGGDPRPDLREAYARYDRALQLVADYGYAHANRGLAFVDQAQYEMDHGHDASASVAEAVRSLQRSVDLLPQLDGTHTRLAGALLLSAEQAIARGQDPGALLERVHVQLREAEAINPRPGPDTLVLHGTAALAAACGQFERGAPGRAPAAAALETALRHLRAAVAGDARMAAAYRRLAEAALLQARVRAASAQDPAPAFAAAESALRQVTALRDRDPRGWAGLAELYRRRAEWTRARGGDPASDVKAGLLAADRALAADATLVEAVQARAALGGGT